MLSKSKAKAKYLFFTLVWLCHSWVFFSKVNKGGVSQHLYLNCDFGKRETSAKVNRERCKIASNRNQSKSRGSRISFSQIPSSCNPTVHPMYPWAFIQKKLKKSGEVKVLKVNCDLKKSGEVKANSDLTRWSIFRISTCPIQAGCITSRLTSGRVRVG